MGTKPMLIAFTGSAGGGKSTAAKYLESKYGYKKVSFANRMKEGLKTMLNLTEEHVNGKLKHELLPELGVSPRELLQTIGTDWGRNMIHPNIWLQEAKETWEQMSHCNGMVIDDLRFENEADWVRSQGGTVIHTMTVPAPAPPVGTTNDNFRSHSSESGVETKKGDIIVYNPLTLGAYQVLIDEAMEEIWERENGNKTAKVEGVFNPDSIQQLTTMIANWANDTFPDRTISNALNKLVMEEIPEYLSSQHCPTELADCAILLFDIAYLANIDLSDAIMKKMDTNRNREWELDSETGLFNHKGGDDE